MPDSVKEMVDMIMKVNEVLMTAYRIGAAELEVLAKEAAPGIHLFGTKLRDGKYAVLLDDGLWLRSDAQFAELDPGVTISYIEVVSKHNLEKVRSSINLAIKKYMLFQRNYMKTLDIKKLKDKLTKQPQQPRKSRKPSHLHPV